MSGGVIWVGKIVGISVGGVMCQKTTTRGKRKKEKERGHSEEKERQKD